MKTALLHWPEYTARGEAWKTLGLLNQGNYKPGMVSKSVIVHRFIALHRECLEFVQVNILGLPPSMLSLMEPTDLIDTRTK